MLRSAASPEARGVRPVRDGVSGLLNDTAPGRPPFFPGPARPQDRPAAFAELDQPHRGRGHALRLCDNRNVLAFTPGHAVDGVLARLEADIGHALRKRRDTRLHL